MLRFTDGDKGIDIDIISSKLTNSFVRGRNRLSMEFKLKAPYSDIELLFRDGAQYSNVTTDEDGAEIVTDLTEYCIAGSITDYRDGTFSVAMSKKTEDELETEHMKASEEIKNILLGAEDGETITLTAEQAEYLRTVIEQAMSSLTQESDDAQSSAVLYPKWKAGEAVTVGAYRRHDGTLYRCIQAHTTQSDWTPDATPALWEVVE